MGFIMSDKLIVIKEYKLFINRYYKIIINLDNRCSDLKNKVINNMFNILNDIYYINLLDINKRRKYQLRIISNIKTLDYYFYLFIYLLFKYHGLLDKHYNNISKDLLTILKLVLGWMKCK